MLALETRGLTKRYGARRGIEGLSLAVEAGQLYGLIGPNGAGKSTLIRTVLGLLRPTAGEARLNGHDVVREGAAARASVGYVPGEPRFDPGLTAGQVLAWRGRFFPGDDTKRRAELVDTFGLDLGAPAADLSLGNQKKLALVAALQHCPALAILDEPTNGLDPVMQSRLFEVLQAEVARGATVIFSSHVLSEVERVCRTVAVLAEGTLAAVENVATLRGRQLRRVTLTLPPDASDPTPRLTALDGLRALHATAETAQFLYGGPMAPLLTTLAALSPRELRIEEPSLEEIFLHHYAPKGAPRA